MPFGTIWRRGAQLLHEEELGLARNVASSTLMTCASSGSLRRRRSREEGSSLEASGPLPGRRRRHPPRANEFLIDYLS